MQFQEIKNLLKKILNHLSTKLVLRVLYFVLFAVGSIGVVLIIINEFPIWEPTSKGFADFFVIFSGPISFYTGGLAIFVLRITIIRMEQTQEQIFVIAKNNQFNNYYKQREEFIKYRDTELLNLPELLKISEILKDEGKSTEAFEFERYLASNCKTEFLRIFAFFFGNHPSELRLPFSENAEEMISNLIVFSQLKTKALEIPIDMPRGLAMPLAINEIARALDKAEQMIIGYRKVESEYPQYSQFNVSFWELYVTKRVLLFLNLKMPELFERAIVEFGRFRKKELNLI